MQEHWQWIHWRKFSIVQVVLPLLVLALSVQAPTPAVASVATPVYLFPWDQALNPRYFTGGPHSTITGPNYATDPTKTAIDFGGGGWQVISIESGIVEFAGWVTDRVCPRNKPCSGSWSGNVVVITHDDGIQSEYWHLSAAEPSLIVGARIPKGYPIGTTGCSGDGAKDPKGTCEDHLHLDFKRGGYRTSDGNWIHGPGVDVTAVVLDGWAIHCQDGTACISKSKDYEGTMTKTGEATRTATIEHCDANNTNHTCSEKGKPIRNDMPSTNRKTILTFVQLAPLMGGPVRQIGETYYSNQVQITYQSGQVILSGDPPPINLFAVDDGMILTVTRPDGTTASWSHVFEVGCYTINPLAPVDITNLFQPGVNLVSVSLYDICGFSEGTANAIFLTYSTSPS